MPVGSAVALCVAGRMPRIIEVFRVDTKVG